MAWGKTYGGDTINVSRPRPDGHVGLGPLRPFRNRASLTIIAHVMRAREASLET